MIDFIILLALGFNSYMLYNIERYLKFLIKPPIKIKDLVPLEEIKSIMQNKKPSTATTKRKPK